VYWALCWRVRRWVDALPLALSLMGFTPPLLDSSGRLAGRADRVILSFDNQRANLE
jgi:hypothetical protein